LANDVIDRTLPKAGPWCRFYKDEYDAAKGDKTKIAALKTKYPNLKIVQDMK